MEDKEEKGDTKQEEEAEGGERVHEYGEARHLTRGEDSDVLKSLMARGGVYWVRNLMCISGFKVMSKFAGRGSLRLEADQRCNNNTVLES